jgi:hypothetical protein
MRPEFYRWLTPKRENGGERRLARCHTWCESGVSLDLKRLVFTAIDSIGRALDPSAHSQESEKCDMKFQHLLTSFLAVGGVLIVAGAVQAQAPASYADLSELNKTVGAQAVATSSWGWPYGDPMYILDQQSGGPLKEGGPARDFLFSNQDGVNNQILVVHGFNTPIDLVRVWSGGDKTNPTSIAVKYSTSDLSTFDGSKYTNLYDTTAAPAASWAVRTINVGGTPTNDGIYWDIPVSVLNAKSLWFDFGTKNELGWAGGQRIVEVQAMVNNTVSATNLFSGKAVVSSSAYYDGDANDYRAIHAVDGAYGGTGADFVFKSGDSQQKLLVHGFDSSIGKVRLWAGDLRPKEVTLYSSKTDLNLSVDQLKAYDLNSLTKLTDTIALDGSKWVRSADGDYYFDVAVDAGNGTQSLLAYFGAGNDTVPGDGFARIQEIQAFSSVPEPSTLAGLIGTALAGLGLVWRNRRR